MSSRSLIGLVLVLIAIGGAAMVMASGNRNAESTPVERQPAEIAMNGAAPDSAGQETSDIAPASGAEATPSAAEPAPAAADLSDEEVKLFLTPRKMGKEDAPVKIVEYASLSCPHCAHFYNDTFPKLKENYIDTGKVLFTYIDFPLDAAALNAAAIAACMPTESYFRYIDYLFETQKDWVFSKDQSHYLIQNAKLLGADETRLTQCSQSEKLKLAITDRMKTEQTAHTIEATPSFLVNGEKIQGTLEFDAFSKKIDELSAANKTAQ